MSTFCAVNTSLSLAQLPIQADEDPAPSTPRTAVFISDTADVDDLSEDAVKTPTRDSFSGVIGQKPLPGLASDSPESRADTQMEIVEEDDGSISPQDTQATNDTSPIKDGKDGSGGESVEGDSKLNKKKKSQRFFCTDYPPCKLSFTRSEHLARHIRKHTGERPFQCHCGRRFSRLDNLRQHAQTVHVNEDIPVDSPAATGSRYQRHIRTDRVRPAGRSRASTFSNPINPAHQARGGHSRNLSSSSITSVSTVSSYAPEELRRGIALDTPRTNRLSLDTYNPPSSAASLSMQQYYTVGANSPTGYSTPTSATFSVGTNSPRYSSGLHSPASSISRNGYHQPQQKVQNRRLSVPSTNQFQAPQNNDSYPQSYMSPAPPAAAALSRAGAQYASPISSYADQRRDTLSTAEAENRRRTWHPNTTTGLGGRPTSSGMGSIPNLAHKPLFPPQQLPQPSNMRLPGIETFDNLVKAPPPAPLIRRQPSPMELDPAPTSHPTDSQSIVQTDDGRPNRTSWTAGLRNGFNLLEITNRPQETPSTWNPANPNAGASDATPRPAPARPTSYHARAHSENLPSIASHPDEMSETEDHPVTPRRAKRMGWYMQPPTEGSKPAVQSTLFRTSPDSSSDGDGAPTPVTSAVDTHPAIVHSNGQVESHSMEGVEEAPKPPTPAVHNPAPSTFRSGYPQASSYVAPNQPNPFGLPRVYESSVPAQFSHSREPSSGMNRLEALVAVATSEEQRV